MVERAPLRHDDPVCLTARLEAAERDRDRYKALAEGERERCAQECFRESITYTGNAYGGLEESLRYRKPHEIAHAIRRLPPPSLGAEKEEGQHGEAD